MSDVYLELIRLYQIHLTLISPSTIHHSVKHDEINRIWRKEQHLIWGIRDLYGMSAGENLIIQSTVLSENKLCGWN
jgi:hypothetical protein